MHSLLLRSGGDAFLFAALQLDMRHEIQMFLRERASQGDLSAYAIAQASGVHPATVRRILSGGRFREWHTIECALAAVGMALVALSPDRGSAMPVGGGSARHPCAMDERLRGTPDPESADGICALISWSCRNLSINAYQLHRTGGIPYASARRLVAGGPLRVSQAIQRILCALGCSLVAVTPAGDTAPVSLTSADPTRGAARRDRHIEHLQRYRRSTPSAARRERGRLLISKAEVAELREAAGLSYAEIGRIAGVSRHRVRQIVLMLQPRSGVRAMPADAAWRHSRTAAPGCVR